MDMYSDKLWLETPLIRSTHISSLLGTDVYLKLEVRLPSLHTVGALARHDTHCSRGATLQTLQPSQSFKSRGISHFAQHARRAHGPGVHLVIASGGNAGLAAACAARELGVRCTVFLPHGVSRPTLDFMRAQGAEVVIRGSFYLEALEAAREAVAAEPNA